LGRSAATRLLAAEVALRELEQQCGGRLGRRVQVAERQQPIWVADQAVGQGMQPLIAPPLVTVYVAGRVEPDRPAAAPTGMHAQHRLLGHRPAGQEHRGRLAGQSGHLGLQYGDHPGLAVAVQFSIRRDRRQQLRGVLRAMPTEKPSAARPQRAELIIVAGHARHCAFPHRALTLQAHQQQALAAAVSQNARSGDQRKDR
jgi:hypothetical protein